MKTSSSGPDQDLQSETIINVKGLRFSYPGKTSDASTFQLHLDRWSVPRGGRIAVHGPSGCGKSTLLDLLAGILSPGSGSLLVAGAELSQMSDSQRRAHRIRHLGFVFQDFPLVDYLDATDNVLLPFRLSKTLTLDAGARDRAQRLLDELGLGLHAHRRPSELSQGEQQRLAIARALVTEPSLLLADEPTAGLDPVRSSKVLDLLERLCEQRALSLVLVTHEPAILERFDLALDAGALQIAPTEQNS